MNDTSTLPLPSGCISGDPSVHIAEPYVEQLRQEYHRLAAQRPDSSTWLHLERAAAALLEKQRHEVCAGTSESWLLEADVNLERMISNILRHDSQSLHRTFDYWASVFQLHEISRHWRPQLDGPSIAYWQHSALVWISLLHAVGVSEADTTGLALFLEAGALEPVVNDAPGRALKWMRTAFSTTCRLFNGGAILSLQAATAKMAASPQQEQPA